MSSYVQLSNAAKEWRFDCQLQSLSTLIKTAVKSLTASFLVLCLALPEPGFAQQIEKYAANEFPSLTNANEPLFAWVEIEFASSPVALKEDRRTTSVQMEFQILRVFGNKVMPPKKLGTIRFDVVREDPNAPRGHEMRPPKRPYLSSMPAKNSKAIVLLEVQSVATAAGDPGDPFAPNAELNPKKTVTPLLVEFSHREICLEAYAGFESWRSLAMACDEAINGEVSKARTMMLDQLPAAALSSKGSPVAMKQWFDECLFRLHKRDGKILYEIAKGKQYGLSRRLNCLQYLCLNGDSWVKSDEFNRIFTECCDGYEKNTTEDIYPSPTQVIRTAFSASMRKELSDKIPIELFEREMDSERRNASYRVRLASAIEPRVNQEDFEDRLSDCLKWLKNDPDDSVKAIIVKMIENIRPLSSAARTKIEQALPELPGPFAERLRAWLDKQKK